MTRNFNEKSQGKINLKNTEPTVETTKITKKKTVRRFVEGKWIEVEVDDDDSGKTGITH